MKKMSKLIISLLLSFSLFIPIPSYAMTNQDDISYFDVYDEDNVKYTAYVIDGSLVIKEIQYIRMGGGLGKCPSTTKTFRVKMTRAEAIKSRNALEQGLEYWEALNFISGLTKFTAPISLASTLIHAGLSRSSYLSQLRKFIDSGKSSATFVFKTRCADNVIQGEPTYDYRVTSAWVEY